MASQSTASASPFPQRLPSHHLHLANETCPTCDQDIPPEKLEEITGKIAAREREQTLAITTKLDQQYAAATAQAEAKAKADLELERQHSAAREAAAREEARQTAEAAAAEKLVEAERSRKELEAGLQEKVDAAEAARVVAEQAGASLQAKAKADLDLERQNSAAREATAREEARQTAEAAAAEKLAEAERSRKELEAGLQEKVQAAEAARITAEQAGASLQTQFQRLLHDSKEELAAVKTAAEANETEIRAEAQRLAQGAAAETLASAEAARLLAEESLQAKITEVEETKTAAEQRAAAMQAQLEELQKAKDDEVAKAKEDAAAGELRARQEATEAAQAAIRDQITAKDQALADAQAKSAEAEGKLATLSEQHELTLKKEIDAQREILEKAKDEAINAEKAKAFEENQKLSTRVNELQRALEKKTNEELGEGAEVNVFEALKGEFPEDRITRIPKGAPGGDILHVVVLHGKECGTIIYDSKNHKAFRTEHVAKLRVDQLAAKAEHAILSTHKFPQGTNQLHMQDGVLLANPARVVLAATLFRQHLIVVHTLRLSGIERESKTAALYDFITSERCTQLLARVDERAEELLDQQAKEIKWHENNWRKQGESIRSIQKAKGDLSNEISLIIGAAEASETILETSEL